MVQTPVLGLSPLNVVLAGVALFTAYKLFEIIYFVFFHPLSKIPGPWWAAASRIPYARAVVQERSIDYLKGLHEQYGPVVRYSPNEISFTEGDKVWQEVYGVRTIKFKGTREFEKDAVFYPPPLYGNHSLLTAPEGFHPRLRKVFAHAFTEKSLRNQESIIQKYADLTVSGIREVAASKGNIIDLNDWFTFFAFDVVADLAFGESFGSLAAHAPNKWISIFSNGARTFKFAYCFNYWPFLQKTYLNLFGLPRSIVERMQWVDHLKEKIDQRIALEKERPDFIAEFLPKIVDGMPGEKDGVTMGELLSNTHLFMGAGTDTTATTLQCAAYMVAKHPEIQAKLTQEVRGRFKSPNEITVEAANGLEYMIAVLTEALRYLAPVPGGFPRKIPEGGATVCGYFLPDNCNASISMTHHVSYHDPVNFLYPDTFAPERWLGDEQYKDDNRAVFQPFSFGPRNCLGKALAYAEMRVVFAKMMFAFDMELADGMEDWVERCTVQALWAKPPMLVRMKAVN